MSRIRRGWALTKKSWALLNEHPRADPLPALRRASPPIAAGDRLHRPGPLPVRARTQLVGGDPAAGDRRLRAQRRRLLLQRRPRRRRRHDLPRPGQGRPSPTGSPSPAAASARSAAGRRSRTAISLVMGAAREPGRHRRPDRRPPGRHGLVAGHLPRRAGDRDRGHRPGRDAEALGLDLPPALGPADHRQHRDRRRRLPDRRAARGAPDRRRHRALVLGQLRSAPCWS